MSKFSFTSIFRISTLICGLFVLSFIPTQSWAQCSLGCTGNTQVSLDMMCEAEITPEMILNDQTTTCMGGVFYVVIEDEYGNQIVPPVGTEGPGVPAIVTDAHKDQTLKARIVDDVSGNACWGWITVEDKIKPVFDCTPPVGPFYCYSLNSFAPSVSDNCTNQNDLTMTLLSDLIYANDCSTAFVDELEDCGFFPDANGTTYAQASADVGLVSYVLKIHTREYLATDECGNVSDPSCELKLVIEAIPDLNDITCPASLLKANGTNLKCDGVYPLTSEGYPAPRGTFVGVFPVEGTISTSDEQNSAMTTYRDTYMIEYVSPNGTCQNVTFSHTGAAGNLQVTDSDGNSLVTPANTVTVSLCDGQRYNIALVAQQSTAPFNYEITMSGPGAAGNFVPDVPYYSDGRVMINLYPDPNVYCNILTTFSDTDLGMIGCTKKILRTWTILEWSCAATQRTSTCAQMIEITDDEGPALTCPSDVSISTNTAGYGSCGALYSPELPTMIDNCCAAEDLSLDISWTIGGVPSGAMTDYDGSAINLPVGEVLVTYTAYDCCYNSSTCSFTVTVADNTPPVAICDQFTVVSLSTDGTAHIYASVFDDGSYDDCHLAGMRVKRMDDGDNCGIDEDEFTDHITVCCNDIGTNVMVQFRVYDTYLANGNLDLTRYNECMVEVEVQDKLGPSLTCPPNITLNCDDTFDFDGDLSAQFGDYIVTDNCGDPTVQDVILDDLDQCNLGVVRRRIRVTDAGGRTAQCVQRITITNNDPFYVNPNDICGATDDDVQWPADVDFLGCDDPGSDTFHPDNTGYPLLSEDQCDLVGVNYSDQVFPFNSGGQSSASVCFKIIRTWTILDWCQLNHPNNNDSDPTNDIAYEWSCTQVIKVNDPDGPTITSSCDDKSTCTFDQTCSNGFIELTATAIDDCTDVLDWWVDIDAFNDGSFDSNLALSGTGGLADASGDYPVGTHTIYWSFKDKCGNVATCSQEFTIINCKAPTAYCINGLATDLMPVDTDGDGQADNGMIEIWANDFDNGSHHVCGYDVVLSFSADIFDTAVTFTCANEGNNTVSVYVTAVDNNGIPFTLPDGSLIQAFCNTNIDIQDNMGVCPDNGGGSMIRISGNVATEDNVSLEYAEVHLGDGVNMVMTDSDGMYAFDDMPNGGSYDIDPSKDNDYMNGVSTLDLVLIQKHILQIGMLDSPYKYIAADVNNDNNITAIDLIELRKLILGIYTEFNANESWRFVDKTYSFVDPTDPLAEEFNETYDIPSLDDDMHIDFVAVKVGDVNNSVVANATGVITESRSNTSLDLYTTNTTFEAGDIVTIPVMATKTNEIVGYQFTLDFDAALMNFQGFSSGSIELNNSNFGTFNANKGQITTSWSSMNTNTVAKDEVLFTLEFVANAAGDLRDVMSINSDITQAEAYSASNEVMNIDLQVRSGNNEYVLYQNTPNPFSVSTDIAFEIPVAQDIRISIFDVTGKRINLIERFFDAGFNQITLNKDVLNTTGVLYYTLEADEYTATRKMVVLK